MPHQRRHQRLKRLPVPSIALGVDAVGHDDAGCVGIEVDVALQGDHCTLKTTDVEI